MKTGTENMTTQALDTFVTKRRSTSKKMREKRRQKHPKSNKRADYSEKNAKSVGGYWLIGYY